MSQGRNRANGSTSPNDMVVQGCKRSPERRHIVDQNVTGLALVGFRGGRPKGNDRGDERLSVDLPACTGAAHAAFGEPVVVDRRCEMLRAGAPAPLARRRPLPAL